MLAEQTTSELLTPQQTADILGLTVRTLLVWRKTRPDFPPPIELSPKTFRYRRADIERWLDQRARAWVDDLIEKGETADISESK